jgi:uncharacterized membrane protein YdjX (TVP38/TMEM64 family)
MNPDRKTSVAIKLLDARLVGLVALIALAAWLYWQFGEYLEVEYLAGREAELKRFQSDHPFLVFGAAFLIYVTVTGLSLPGATLLTLVTSWYFGFWPGFVLVSFASTAGATFAFALCRYFFRDFIQERFDRRLHIFNASLEREGAFYLFTLRLIPVVPFFVINAVMGLTKMRARTFWWVSQLGMLPGTAVYVYAGSRVPDLQTLAEKGIAAVFSSSQLWQFTLAFLLLGLFPLLARWFVRYVQSKRDVPVSGQPADTVVTDEDSGR